MTFAEIAKAAKITQEEIAERTGISRRTIGTCLRENHPPKYRALAKTWNDFFAALEADLGDE